VRSREPTKKELIRIGKIKTEVRGIKRKGEDAGLEEMEDDEEEDEDGEMKYESGEEGKGEGYWEKEGAGKRVKR